MAEKKKKSDLLLAEDDADAKGKATLEDFNPNNLPARRKAPSHSMSQKQIRKISPLGMRVLVALRKENDQTDAGLYLPEGAKQNMQESVLAEVLEVASAIDEATDEETNVSGIPLGAVVLILKQSGTKVPWDDNLRIIETKEVLAIVHEIDVT